MSRLGGIVCPSCGAAKTEVLESRPRTGCIYRRRQCAECRHGFATYETTTRPEDIQSAGALVSIAKRKANGTYMKPVGRPRKAAVQAPQAVFTDPTKDCPDCFWSGPVDDYRTHRRLDH